MSRHVTRMRILGLVAALAATAPVASAIADDAAAAPSAAPGAPMATAPAYYPPQMGGWGPGGMPWQGGGWNGPWGGSPWGGSPWGGGNPWNNGAWGGGMPWNQFGNGGPWNGGWMNPSDPKGTMTRSWDEMMNAPSRMGTMPGGWRAPTISVPNPVDVGEQFGNAAQQIPNQMNNFR
ncbi:MAG: hypothetical protein H6981_11025 [Gammaproteobacteria bacterium]|nr:hypothetical protein [Gammaproteobacteria bacterium]MCP5137318.1 hypothetical protein [Gammaproteobacteria bacterium]